jgi:hypothetical protein
LTKQIEENIKILFTSVLNDKLIGTSRRDMITDLGGNDRFNGCSRDDTLNGNSGNDV